ncbi:MAG: YnbE family lipoprotein [Rhodobacterales bacterium]|nr:YnbE family lipoprotein [Rhodobacterales bacterium]
MNLRATRLPTLGTLCAALILAGACSPTVKVEPSDKPIVINLNVKIEHEVRVKVEKELDDLFAKDKELFQ